MGPREIRKEMMAKSLSFPYKYKNKAALSQRAIASSLLWMPPSSAMIAVAVAIKGTNILAV